MCRECGNDVVGFEPVGIVGADAECVGDLPKPWELHDEFFGRWRALAFVFGIELVSEFGTFFFVR